MQNSRSAEIARLNDELRTSLGKKGGKVVMTTGIQGFSPQDQVLIFQKLRAFNDFTEDNDPYGEHDFGRFSHDGEMLLWKIDYYDLDYQGRSNDPSDPKLTNRVLTLMLSQEY